MKQRLATLLWNASEASGLPLGWLAPHVFGWMIGATPIKKVDL